MSGVWVGVRNTSSNIGSFVALVSFQVGQPRMDCRGGFVDVAHIDHIGTSNLFSCRVVCVEFLKMPSASIKIHVARTLEKLSKLVHHQTA